MGDKMETMTDFIFLASKITADGDCSHDIKRHLVHRRKPMTNLDNWCFWTVVLEKTLESPLDCKEIKPVNSKGNQSWIFTGRTDAEALIFWPPDLNNQLIGKDPDAGKDWGQDEKGVIEEKMVGWHHGINGHEFEQTPENSEGQGPWCSVHGVTKSQIWLSNWTATATIGLAKKFV